MIFTKMIDCQLMILTLQ